MSKQEKVAKGLPKDAYRDFCRKYPRASNTVLYITGTKRMLMFDRVKGDDKKWINFKNSVKYVHLRLWLCNTEQLNELGIGGEVYMSQEQRNQWIESFWMVAKACETNTKLAKIAEKMFPDQYKNGDFDKTIAGKEAFVAGVPF